MKLILKADVAGVGHRGDIVDVADGFGRNYLLPQGLALAVTDANKAMIDKERKAWEARQAKEKSDCESLAQRIGALRFVAPRKVGENEQLFGSVTASDVAEFLKGKGIDVDKRKILLPDALKALGEVTVSVKLHREVTAQLKVTVAKE